MELERIASDLYREFPRNAEKLSKEMEKLSGLLEETGAAVMMEIEKEKYRKEKDPDRIKDCADAVVAADAVEAVVGMSAPVSSAAPGRQDARSRPNCADQKKKAMTCILFIRQKKTDGVASHRPVVNICNQC